MSDIASRPKHLPDFASPPLNEVVLGVQFSQPKGYQQIYAGEIWNLFKKEFTQVQEQSPLPPTFETFGLPVQFREEVNFITGAIPSRFWFIRPSEDELIQFQSDRVLHNWRKVGDKTNEYPRFEYIIDRFKNELEQIQTYVSKFSLQSLIINQCEVSYINHIIVEKGEEFKPSDWLRFITFGDKKPDDFSISFREVIHGVDGKPCGRLICDSMIGFKADGQKLIQLNLTVRGAPQEPNIKSAIDFITIGRGLIVSRFAELTTEEAHEKWRRIK